jgi:hypothetical protein
MFALFGLGAAPLASVARQQRKVIQRGAGSNRSDWTATRSGATHSSLRVQCHAPESRFESPSG